MSKVFFPQALLDHCVVEGLAEIRPGELVLVPFDRKYVVAESIRVVEEVTGQADPHGFIGKVKVKKVLEEMGAEIVEDSMLIGENAYAIIPGFAGNAETALEAWLPLAPESAKGFASEDELLRAFIAKAGA